MNAKKKKKNTHRRVRSRAGDRVKFIMQVHNPIKTRLPYNQVEGFSSGCVQRRRSRGRRRRRRCQTDSSIAVVDSILNTRAHEDKDVLLLLLLLFSNGGPESVVSGCQLVLYLRATAHPSRLKYSEVETVELYRINYTIESTVTVCTNTIAHNVVASPKTHIIAFVDFCIN